MIVSGNKKWKYKNEEVLISRFRELLDPDNSENGKVYEEEFNAVCELLAKNNYEVEGRNPNSFDYNRFANNDIKTKTRTNYGDSCGKVTWASRRKYIQDDLHISKKSSPNIEFSDELAKHIDEILINGNEFKNKSLDEKLRDIKDCFGNLVNANGGWKGFDWSMYSPLEENSLSPFIKSLHSFRHAENKSVQKRKSYSDEDKEYMIDLAITLLKRFYKSLK